MIKYRPHRGSLDEAMKEYKEFTDIAEMLKIVHMFYKLNLYMLKYIINVIGGVKINEFFR